MSKDNSRALPFRHPDELSDYVIIDLETTGLDPETSKIIQLSAVRFLDHKGVATFSEYINPGIHIPEEVSALTGITDEVVAAAPTIKDKIQEFLEFVCASPFVAGWNVSFDTGFLNRLDSVDESVLSGAFDVMTIYGRITGHPYSRLSDACAHINYSTNFHNALNDCYACGAVLSWMCRDNRMDHALHSKGEKNAALKAYLKKSSSGVCPVSTESVKGGGILEGKSVVFTGALNFPRAAAESLAAAAGAIVKGSVSKKTDYLVVGEQDEVIVGCDGKSSKEEKAEALNQKGASISIISEKDFLDLVQR